MKGRKRLFKILVTELCQYSGRPIPYWTHAYSEDQAKKQVRDKFNEEHEKKQYNYVEMHIEKEVRYHGEGEKR